MQAMRNSRSGGRNGVLNRKVGWKNVPEQQICPFLNVACLPNGDD
jgi:hypothetical protein